MNYDGNVVFAHTDYNVFGPKVGFDIFRFEDGKIVEHWDNLQDTAARPGPSGHTMVDGPTTASDLDKTEANKALMQTYMDDLLYGRRDTDRPVRWAAGRGQAGVGREARPSAQGARGRQCRARRGGGQCRRSPLVVSQ